ncbi:MAG: TylF/MycF family methyltransferase [Acidobacteriota bacterium]|nr:TylF/MycF family methyltransferase [Acidobacteriota bacterium]
MPALSPAELYLDLLKKCLIRSIFPDEYRPLLQPGSGQSKWQLARHAYLGSLLARLNFGLYRKSKVDPVKRSEGRDWPPEAETMIGLKRLDQLQACITDVLASGVPGDLIETGVWRGGSAILMCAVLNAYGETGRMVWVADSFAGLPKPDGRYQQDRGDVHWRFHSVLAVPVEVVKANFARYGLLTERVRFLEGWFKDTLPAAPIARLAILRVDGDMYSSTMDVLENLYPRLSPGGYAIIDDYGAVPACRQAVEDYRARNGIAEPIQRIDWTGVFWRKEG